MDACLFADPLERERMQQQESAHYQSGHLVYGATPPAWVTEGRNVLLLAQQEEQDQIHQQRRIEAMSRRANASQQGWG